MGFTLVSENEPSLTELCLPWNQTQYPNNQPITITKAELFLHQNN